MWTSVLDILEALRLARCIGLEHHFGFAVGPKLMGSDSGSPGNLKQVQGNCHDDPEKVMLAATG